MRPYTEDLEEFVKLLADRDLTGEYFYPEWTVKKKIQYNTEQILDSEASDGWQNSNDKFKFFMAPYKT